MNFKILLYYTVDNVWYINVNEILISNSILLGSCINMNSAIHIFVVKDVYVNLY